MNIAKQIAEELSITVKQTEAVISLIDEGNTIPFIARYRKEQHGALNDEVLRHLEERLTYLRNLEEKRNSVVNTLKEQGNLTKELEKALDAVTTLVELEDLYRPFRPKRRTRAMIAKEKGLEPLAKLLLSGKKGAPETFAKEFVSEQSGVATVEEALEGASDILAEALADDAKMHKSVRDLSLKEGMFVVKQKEAKENSVYEGYFDYSELAARIPGHRLLAMNRGEREGELKVGLEVPEEKIYNMLYRWKVVSKEVAPFYQKMILDSYKRLMAQSIEREIRSERKEQAETEAIEVFRKNLTQLLLQPPIAGQVVLGWDPAFRTGCKLAVVDATGKVLDTTVIYPTSKDKTGEESRTVLDRLVKKYGITVFSVGNGTASRESEQFIADYIAKNQKHLSYVITNEAGASVYSASQVATDEFPTFDVGQRSAVSIARRLQDPLAELVKIDPRSIGVGQYQHDMDQKRLSLALEAVVEDCVNKVGVDLNTASAYLLRYISGISKTVAENIVAYRETNGRFTNRKELKKVAKLGPKAFEQCAGFLRISGGIQPLDGTGVHPEHYAEAEILIKRAGYQLSDLSKGGLPGIGKKLGNLEALSKELGIGVLTLQDIVNELEKPGRDPRDEMPKPLLRSDVLAMEDLKVGMVLKGTVRNVIDFGAFVDIGVHQDGLVHISQICDRFIRHPLEAVSVGDVVTVKILDVNLAKKRISLTMKGI